MVCGFGGGSDFVSDDDDAKANTVACIRLNQLVHECTTCSAALIVDIVVLHAA